MPIFVLVSQGRYMYVEFYLNFYVAFSQKLNIVQNRFENEFRSPILTVTSATYNRIIVEIFSVSSFLLLLCFVTISSNDVLKFLRCTARPEESPNRASLLCFSHSHQGR